MLGCWLGHIKDKIFGKVIFEADIAVVDAILIFTDTLFHGSNFDLIDIIYSVNGLTSRSSWNCRNRRGNTVSTNLTSKECVDCIRPWNISALRRSYSTLLN